MQIEKALLTFDSKDFKYSVKNFNVSNGEWISFRMRRSDIFLQLFLENKQDIRREEVILPKSFKEAGMRLAGSDRDQFEGNLSDLA